MNRLIAAGVAIAAIAASTGADAARCSCSRTTHRVHHHVRHVAVARTTTTVVAVPAAVTIEHAVPTTADRPTYVADGDYIPDPQRPDVPLLHATATEDEIAHRLNRSLDTWRACGWDGQEHDAAIFVQWSRTHLEADPSDPHRSTIAWRPFGETSALHLARTSEPEDRAVTCGGLAGHREELRIEMNHQADELRRAHMTAHS